MYGKLGVWKGVLWICFVKGLLLGYLDGIFLGQVNGCEMRASDGFPWKISNGSHLGHMEGFLVRKFRGTLTE